MGSDLSLEPFNYRRSASRLSPNSDRRPPVNTVTPPVYRKADEKLSDRRLVKEAGEDWGEESEGVETDENQVKNRSLKMAFNRRNSPTMSVAELKERHLAATETVNALRERLKQKRLLLLDTDVAGYARSEGKTLVRFGPTDLVSCRTLQGLTGKDFNPVMHSAGLFTRLESEKNRIVSASQDGRLIVWNALTSQKTHAIKLPCAWVMTCAFSPTGHSVTCGGLDSVCSIFDLNSPTDKDGNITVSRTLSGHKGYVSCCQYVPDEETRLITSSGDQTCVLWDITTGQRTSVFGGEFQCGHTADVLR
ncbi:hypothetical protein Vadar_026067 [Vaccinium darrowii]|uniref:Uncharacterized protein n=1 Tax=Vaccinium darrowii TaxID=229202 RepID=A0ACB7YYP4_9ERIC|nr:hypothetical protein Vadar_026067 [Vaccinium darrowii]